MNSKNLFKISCTLLAALITMLVVFFTSSCTPEDDIVPKDESQFKTIYLPIEFKFMGVNFEHSYVYQMTNKETGEIGWGELPSQYYSRAIHTLITEYDMINALNVIYKPCGIQFYRHMENEVISYEQLDKVFPYPPYFTWPEDEKAINTITIYFIGDSQYLKDHRHPVGPTTIAGQGDNSCSGWIYVSDSYDIGLAPAFFEHRLRYVIDETFSWGGKDEHDYEGIRNSVDNAIQCRLVRQIASDHPL